MVKLSYSFGIIISGLALGYLIQILVSREIIQLPIGIEELRKRLQKTARYF